MYSFFQNKRRLLLFLFLICSACDKQLDYPSTEKTTSTPTHFSLPPEWTPTPRMVLIEEDVTPTKTLEPTQTIPPTTLPHTHIPPTQTQAPVITPASTPTQNPNAKLQIVDQFGGAIHDLEAEGSYLYMGLGMRVAVIDISNPWDPHFTGLSEILNGVVTDISLSGNMAFVVTHEGGLTALNLSNPNMLQIIGTSQTLYKPSAITSIPGYVFVTERSECIRDQNMLCNYVGGLEIFDVSNPREIQTISVIESPSGYLDIAIKGDHAYITGGGAGLSIFDISKPNEPKVLGKLDEHYAIGEIAIVGNYAYLNSSEFCCMVVDITDPSSPMVKTEVLRLMTGDIDISNNYIYNLWVYCDMGGCGSGFNVIETIDNLPRIVDGSVKFIGRLEGGFASSNLPVMTVHGNMAYTTGPRGIQVIDVHNPSNPALIGELAVPDNVNDVAIYKDYAYIPLNLGIVGFHILDLTHLSGPYPVISFYEWEHPIECSFFNLKITIQKTLGLISTSHEGPEVCKDLEIIDLQHPLTPSHIWAKESSFGTYKHAVFSNNLLYLLSFMQNIEFLDISNPRNPSHFGYLSDLENTIALSVDEQYGYLWIKGEGLRIYDWSNIESPQLVSQLQWEGVALDIAIENDIALVSHDSILAIDVSDPFYPQVIASFELPISVENITVADGILYASAGEAGLLVIEFTHWNQ